MSTDREELHRLLKADMDRGMRDMRDALDRAIYGDEPFLAWFRPRPVPWWTRHLWWPVRTYLYGWRRVLTGVWQALRGQPVLECDEWDD